VDSLDDPRDAAEMLASDDDDDDEEEDVNSAAGATVGAVIAAASAFSAAPEYAWLAEYVDTGDSSAIVAAGGEVKDESGAVAFAATAGGSGTRACVVNSPTANGSMAVGTGALDGSAAVIRGADTVDTASSFLRKSTFSINSR
jgi:hypothetical protein